MKQISFLLFAACSYARYYDLPLRPGNESSITIRLHVPIPTPVRWTNSCVTSMPLVVATQMPNTTKTDKNATTSMQGQYYNEAETSNIDWVVFYLTILAGALAM